jgi:hypothetical protein
VIWSGTIVISRGTAELIAAAAEEHGHGTGRQAALAIEAAARLFAADRRTTAVPDHVVDYSAPVVTVHVALASNWLAIIADAALEHGLGFESQLRAVLDASVAAYKPPKPLAVPEPPPVKRVKAVPRIRPFDPAYYAKHAAAFK